MKMQTEVTHRKTSGFHAQTMNVVTQVCAAIMILKNTKTKNSKRQKPQQQMNQKNHLTESLERKKSCGLSAPDSLKHPLKASGGRLARESYHVSYLEKNAVQCSTFSNDNYQHKTIFYCLYILYMMSNTGFHCFTSFKLHDYSQSGRQPDRRSCCSA